MSGAGRGGPKAGPNPGTPRPTVLGPGSCSRPVPFASRERAACAGKPPIEVSGREEKKPKKKPKQRGNLYLATGRGETPRSRGAWPCHRPHAEPCCGSAPPATFPRSFSLVPLGGGGGDALPVCRRAGPAVPGATERSPARGPARLICAGVVTRGSLLRGRGGGGTWLRGSRHRRPVRGREEKPERRSRRGRRNPLSAKMWKSRALNKAGGGGGGIRGYPYSHVYLMLGFVCTT